MALQRVTVHALASRGNAPREIQEALQGAEDDLHPGLRLEGPGVELVVGECVPSAGRVTKRTEVILADQVLQVFKKVHVLPYKARFSSLFIPLRTAGHLQVQLRPHVPEPYRALLSEPPSGRVHQGLRVLL